MILYRIIGGMVFALTIPMAVRQTQAFEERTVTDIKFTPWQPLDPADLAKALALQKGDVLQVRAVAKSIDGLFATGRF